MTTDDVGSILALDSYERYEYFLDVVADTEEIWFVQDEGGHVISVDSDEGDGGEDNDDCSYMPLWPTEELAAVFIDDAQEVLTIEKINVFDFLKNWIPGLHEDGLKAGLLPNLDVTVWLMEPYELQEDLIEELDSDDAP